MKSKRGAGEQSNDQFLCVLIRLRLQSSSWNSVPLGVHDLSAEIMCNFSRQDFNCFSLSQPLHQLLAAMVQLAFLARLSATENDLIRSGRRNPNMGQCPTHITRRVVPVTQPVSWSVGQSLVFPYRRVTTEGWNLMVIFASKLNSLQFHQNAILDLGQTWNKIKMRRRWLASFNVRNQTPFPWRERRKGSQSSPTSSFGFFVPSRPLPLGIC